MFKHTVVAILSVLVFCLLAIPTQAVTRDELIKKCMDAGNIVKTQGLDAAIKAIEDTRGAFVWHDKINYLFLMDLKGKMLAHPFKPELKKAENLMDFADVNGSLFIVEFIKAATSKVGMGWVRYMWPLPGKTNPIQKYTFIYRIPDTDYLIGSGLYVIKPGEYY